RSEKGKRKARRRCGTVSAMARMLDVVREKGVPEPVLQSMADGQYPLPPIELIEILVELTHDPRVGIRASETLSRWNAEQLREIAADANTPRTVLNYFLEPRHRRMDLMMPLIANKGVS